jgi:BirA family transcriptional regulator, biotin operon repressor / biotin---[acetyl-CoA-carboxylase] ligase
LSAERLRELLRARGRDWPGELETFAVLGSTNDELRERARAGGAAWLAVTAESQTAGRGRRGHTGASPPRNLYQSVLVPKPSRLKWPNDLQTDGRKLAGFSAEASLGGGAPEAVVLGIGVNVRVNPLGDQSTSLLEQGGEGLEPLDVAAAVLVHVYDRHAELQSGAAARLLEAWRARSVAWWGRAVEVVSGEQALRGVAVDVDASGALVLELPDGRRQLVVAGEARELRLDGR